MVKPHLSVFVCLQGEQLCGFLQLQVFHPLPGLLAGVLSVHRGHRAAVLHKILDSEYRRAFALSVRWMLLKMQIRLCTEARLCILWFGCAWCWPLLCFHYPPSPFTLRPLCFPSLLSPALTHWLFVLWSLPPLSETSVTPLMQSQNTSFFFLPLLLFDVMSLFHLFVVSVPEALFAFTLFLSFLPPSSQLDLCCRADPYMLPPIQPVLSWCC